MTERTTEEIQQSIDKLDKDINSACKLEGQLEVLVSIQNQFLLNNGAIYISPTDWKEFRKPYLESPVVRK